MFSIYEENCIYQCGRRSGWQLVGICADKDAEDEPLCPFFVVTMIWYFKQSECIKVHMPPPGSPDENQYDPTEDNVME